MKIKYPCGCEIDLEQRSHFPCYYHWNELRANSSIKIASTREPTDEEKEISKQLGIQVVLTSNENSKYLRGPN